ncbi:hypothetical protein FHT44_004930 [Mycolicibacterium sp. BK634]|uniref:hypothetical protein n=1 Tax=Mycolicibacterium sp. BK634 TaxID=2587099 RepID=UPI00160E21D7|nr:hypothetical protein [Mycolicibacterium sp. BK634]MBB3752418.1 hypothetical protein [Mycolicibacterium sp. BK634]
MPDRTLAGRPVRGEHPKYSNHEVPEQRPISEFLAKLDSLFAFPEVEAVRWHQYTPYFNDGEECVFSIREAYVKFFGVDEGGDYEDGYTDGKEYPPDYWDTHYHTYHYGRVWDRDLRQTVDKPPPEGKLPHEYKARDFYVNGVLRPEIGEAFKAVKTAVSSGVHEVEFLDVFGDPAQVTATRDGFDVEFYEHE